MDSFLFLSPWCLLALLSLPLLWRLLRHFPPRPQNEIFPFFYLLKNLKNSHPSAHKPALWQILLRLCMAVLLILFFAHPVLQKKSILTTEVQPLVLLLDDSWANADQFASIKARVQEILQSPQQTDKEIYLAFTVKNKQNFGPYTAQQAQAIMQAAQPTSLPPMRQKVLQALSQQLAPIKKSFDLLYFNDGLAQANDAKAFALLKKIKIDNFLWYLHKNKDLMGIINVHDVGGSLQLKLARAHIGQAQSVEVGAYNLQNQKIIQREARFAKNAAYTFLSYQIPLEIRNQIAWFKIEGQQNTAATFLLGSKYQRKRIALLAPPPEEMAQKLLSPFYYIEKALIDKNDIIFSNADTLEKSLKGLLQKNPALLILKDMRSLPAYSEEKLREFVEKGGTLLRFSGPLIAMEGEKDRLLPTPLSTSIRSLGGNLTFEKPQKIARFYGPFSDFSLPENVRINKQILPQTQSNLYQNIWAELEDGTPLITAKKIGKGFVIFIHTSLDQTWSNLPLTPFFVSMLQRIADISKQEQNALTSSYKEEGNNTQSLQSWRLLSPQGDLVLLKQETYMLNREKNKTPTASLEHPPGFYGSLNHLFALNLLNENSFLAPISIPSMPLQLVPETAKQAQKDFAPFLLIALILLFLLDSLLTLKPLISLKITKWRSSFLCFIGLFCLCFSFLYMAGFSTPLQAQTKMEEKKPHSAPITAIEAAGQTHLAYIKTDDRKLDTVSNKGLSALSAFIASHSTVSPAQVVGIDIEKDELAFYPLLYWPIRANQADLSMRAIEKLNFYMQHGGTILFDTGDQVNKRIALPGELESGASLRLKQILNRIDIPPLEKVSQQNVLARSFYILSEFPGRYSGSPLWASALEGSQKEAFSSRDGVSPILITANDFAAAWARDQNGNFLFPLAFDDPQQRIWAFRTGLNIVLYVLTGNYKTDQMHTKIFLERLQQREKN